MFYILIFSLLAVLLVVAGITSMSRRRRNLAREEVHTTHGDAGRRNQKAKRAQSQHDRRKRH